MFSTLASQQNPGAAHLQRVSSMARGTGVAALTQRPSYTTYKSPFGPDYKAQPHFHGVTMKKAAMIGMKLGGFGVVAGIAVLFLGEGIPRVQRDVLQKVPILGDYWIRETPPSDNVSRIQDLLPKLGFAFAMGSPHSYDPL